MAKYSGYHERMHRKLAEGNIDATGEGWVVEGTAVQGAVLEIAPGAVQHMCALTAQLDHPIPPPPACRRPGTVGQPQPTQDQLCADIQPVCGRQQRRGGSGGSGRCRAGGGARVSNWATGRNLTMRLTDDSSDGTVCCHCFISHCLTDVTRLFYL